MARRCTPSNPATPGGAWAELGRTLPTPARGADGVRALGNRGADALRQARKPETIHDFGGFPPELYRIAYPAPGAPGLATQCVALLKAGGIAAGVDGCRGLDHGAWVPLRWMYPEADIPVVQLSVQPGLGAAHHVQLGRALAPLAGDGVLIIGSGHTTHNLRDWMANARRPEPLKYAQAFSAWLAAALAAHDTDALVALSRTRAGRRARASQRRALPAAVRRVRRRRRQRRGRSAFVDGFLNGALAMDSYLFHADEAMAHA